MHFQFWPFIIPVPVKGQVHMVPHLKALYISNWSFEGLKPGVTFTLCHSLLKIGTLKHKVGFVRFEVAGTIPATFNSLSSAEVPSVVFISKVFLLEERLNRSSKNRFIWNLTQSLLKEILLQKTEKRGSRRLSNLL